MKHDGDVLGDCVAEPPVILSVHWWAVVVDSSVNLTCIV